MSIPAKKQFNTCLARNAQVDENGHVSLADLKAIFTKYMQDSEDDGEQIISEARMKQLLADAGIDVFRGKLDTAKMIDAMSFKR